MIVIRRVTIVRDSSVSREEMSEGLVILVKSRASIRPWIRTRATVTGRNVRIMWERIEFPSNSLCGKASGPVVAHNPTPKTKKAIAVGSATGITVPPYKNGDPSRYPIRSTNPVVATAVARKDGNHRRRVFREEIERKRIAEETKIKPPAVIGDMRPAGTTSDFPVTKKNNPSIFKLMASMK